MNIDLTDTTTRRIQDALTRARHQMGGPAVGMVLTLVIVTDESAQYDSLRAATEAAREHPCRVLTVISRDARGSSSRLDAEIRIGETGPGETVLLRMYGPLADHAVTVALPLLFADAPVVTWWPGQAPADPAGDPLGALAQRRITDSYAGLDRLGTLCELARSYQPGDTDFAWSRLTSWRTLLAASLDQPTPEIISGQVVAEPDSPSAELLAAWLSVRLGVPVSREFSTGPGITAVTLATVEGDLSITRPDGRVATLSRPGQPDRQVALIRRPMSELLAEELRRLDPDEVYADAVRRFEKDYLALTKAAAAVEAEAEAEAAAEFKAELKAEVKAEIEAEAPAPKPRATRRKAAE
ncbi:glucose-6-phosphate dehydrogenase assembly protein OpcA [Actinocorallia lasiicapitis]